VKEWQTKTVGEVAEVIAGQSPDGKAYNADGKGMPFYQGKKEFGDKYIGEPTTWTTEVTRVARKGDVLMSVRAPVGPVNFATQEMCIGRGLAAIRSRNELDRDFLFNFLLHKRDEIEGTEGAVFASINKSQIEAIKIPVPPLLEQQRIVGILDEAFAGIATAKANAETNLRNARALFESHLETVLVRGGKGWHQRRLGDLVTRLTNGYVGPTRNIYIESGVPYLLARHVKNNRLAFDRRTFVSEEFNAKNKKSILRAGDVLLVQSGHIGHSAVVTQEHAGHNCHAMIVISPIDGVLTGPYLSLLFNSVMRKKFDQIKSGSTVPHLNCGSVIELPIPLPDVSTQQRVVDSCRELASHLMNLEDIYTQKLAALDALKKSLLHQAFTGQLTRDEPATTVSPLPVTIPNISTTDLHAGILAMACQRHEAAGRLGEFTHVKAEKFAHMVEARLGIDLGRKPVKDAAGPNDFNHLKKVEHRARMTNAFDFKRVEGGAYRVQKLRGFGRLVEKTRAALGDQLVEVEDLLGWMLPMNVRQAEIVATVYAAWNNLLLDGKTPTDEEIVFESRENWHPDKLKIDRGRFFSAVQWLRDQDVVPEGKGRRVGEKGGSNGG
jgi:type I restriction enzyme S subunit